MKRRGEQRPASPRFTLTVDQTNAWESHDPVKRERLRRKLKALATIHKRTTFMVSCEHEIPTYADPPAH